MVDLNVEQYSEPVRPLVCWSDTHLFGRAVLDRFVKNHHFFWEVFDCLIPVGWSSGLFSTGLRFGRNSRCFHICSGGFIGLHLQNEIRVDLAEILFDRGLRFKR